MWDSARAKLEARNRRSFLEAGHDLARNRKAGEGSRFAAVWRAAGAASVSASEGDAERVLA
jgi:hypothetical protein